MLLQVGDLGVASQARSMLHSTVGTLPWMAPEVFEISGTASYDKRADVYSFGIILWELWTQQLPYQGDDEEGIPEASVCAWGWLMVAFDECCGAGTECFYAICSERWPAQGAK